MPGFRTHYLFGRRAAGELSSLKDYAPTRKHSTCYQLGQQGPDLFFYYPLGYLLYKKNIGFRMHHEGPMAFIDAMISYRQRLKRPKDREIADAYICGFIGHYTLDTTVHPYIHYRTKKLENNDRPAYIFGIHVLLETDVDNATLMHYMHLKPSEFYTEDTVDLTPHERRVVSALIAHSISKTYPGNRMGAWQVDLAIRFLWLVNHLMHDPKAIKKKLVRLFDEIVFGHAFISAIMSIDAQRTYTDPCNLRHKTWHNPWDDERKSDKDIYQLMDDALVDYEKRLGLYRKITELPRPSRLRSMLEARRFNKGKGPHVLLSHAAADFSYYHDRNALLTELSDLDFDSGLPIQ